MVMARPRMRRISASGVVSRSRPAKRTRPPSTRAPEASDSRAIVMAVTDLPDPDSPTSASVPPRLQREGHAVHRPPVRPSWARPSWTKPTARSWTDSSGSEGGASVALSVKLGLTAVGQASGGVGERHPAPSGIAAASAISPRGPAPWLAAAAAAVYLVGDRRPARNHTGSNRTRPAHTGPHGITMTDADPPRAAEAGLDEDTIAFAGRVFQMARLGHAAGARRARSPPACPPTSPTTRATRC